MTREFALKNPHLDESKIDRFYHLGFASNDDLVRRLSDVRIVCVAGTVRRVQQFAERMRTALDLHGEQLQDLAAAGQRFSMFKVGPILAASHGIGGPSLSVLLHELLKLIKCAGVRDGVTMLRIGTSGGVGIPPGTVVVSDGAMNDLLQRSHTFHVLGKAVQVPCVCDPELTTRIADAARSALPDVPLVIGTTMSASDFYEAQARLDGAFCDFDAADRVTFLHELRNRGVANIEMEASLFTAMCHRAGVPAGVICVTLVDRMVSDQITADEHVLRAWQERLQKAACAFVLQHLRKGF